jgi:O-antigen/teichoic acid export membrane protein
MLLISKFRLIYKHKDKLSLGLMAIVQVLISFITNFIIVKEVGFSAELDVFYIALAVFSFLTTSVGWSISSVLTPMLVEYRGRNIEGGMFISLFFISFSILAISLVSSIFWIELVYVNYLGSIGYSKIFTIQGVILFASAFNIMNVLFVSIFQERNNFIGLSSVNLFVSVVGCTFVYYTIELFGVFSAVMNQLIVQVCTFTILLVYTYSVIVNDFYFDRRKLNILWSRMKYSFVGSFYFRTDELIERVIASFLSPGFLSLISFIQRIHGAIIVVLNTAVVAPTVTKFSSLYNDSRTDECKRIYYSYLFFLILVDSFLLMVMYILGEYLFIYFFGDKISLSMLPMVFDSITILFAMVFGKTIGMLQRSLLMASRKEKAVTFMNVFVFTVNLMIKISLTYYFGMYGLLVAFLIGEFFTILVQQIYINNKVLYE